MSEVKGHAEGRRVRLNYAQRRTRLRRLIRVLDVVTGLGLKDHRVFAGSYKADKGEGSEIIAAVYHEQVTKRDGWLRIRWVDTYVTFHWSSNGTVYGGASNMASHRVRIQRYTDDPEGAVAEMANWILDQVTG